MRNIVRKIYQYSSLVMWESRACWSLINRKAHYQQREIPYSTQYRFSYWIQPSWAVTNWWFQRCDYLSFFKCLEWGTNYIRRVSRHSDTDIVNIAPDFADELLFSSVTICNVIGKSDQIEFKISNVSEAVTNNPNGLCERSTSAVKFIYLTWFALSHFHNRCNFRIYILHSVSYI
jgi:hypothetical protein